jgi:purine-binding chemotaxis protein CheW
LAENAHDARRARLLSAPVREIETRDMSLLVRAGTQLCALPLAGVVETMRPLPIEGVSGAPAYVRGLAIIRGSPVPVVDLAALVAGATLAPDDDARFVTVRAADRIVALFVSRVVGVRTLAPASLHDLPPLLRDANADVVRSVGALDAELLLVLRSARLVPDLAAAGGSA